MNDCEEIVKPSIFIFIVLLMILCSCPTAARRTDISINAVDLLNESYTVARELGGRERIAYLVRLTRASANIAPPEATRRWCEELFMLASRSPLSWDHVANQKNAAVALASINPARAMEMLEKVDLPQSLGGRLPEDVRANAAISIFPRFWRIYGKESLAQIRSVAKKTGETGQYPYHAMATVISDLIRSGQDRAGSEEMAIFQEALDYYGRHSEFENEDEEFLDLLAILRDLAARDLYRHGLELFIKHVSVNRKRRDTFVANVRTSQDMFLLSDENQLLLLRAFPLISGFDHTWAQKLRNQMPYLRGVDETGIEFGATVIQGKPFDTSESRNKQRLEQALLSNITRLSNSNPLQALQLANDLTTGPVRIMGTASILPSLVNYDPVFAKQIYAQEMQEMRYVSDPHDRLRALVPLAMGAFLIHDRLNFFALVDEILDRGGSLFEKDLSRNRADLRNGYREMGSIVQFAAEHREQWIVQKVGDLPNPLLRAHLMVYLAKGLAEQSIALSAN